MKFRGLLLSGLLLLSCAFARATTEPGHKTSFSLKTRTQIPGRILQPGTYSLTFVDHLRDRIILRVDGQGIKTATFLGLPSSAAATVKGPVLFNAGGSAPSALRGFTFADGSFAEFVYPKEEAVALAKANNAKIPAIDPASEGKSNLLPSLSRSDMELVTLWVLSPTTVGPDSVPGIEAARYKAPAEQASADLPSPPPTRRVRKPVIVILPHTASDLPLLPALGLLSLLGAGALTHRRLTLQRA